LKSKLLEPCPELVELRPLGRRHHAVLGAELVAERLAHHLDLGTLPVPVGHYTLAARLTGSWC
jgi:hypothetical protein